MSWIKKQKKPQLDSETASKILELAFEANQREPNTIPLDVLTAYSNYRRERFTLQRTILVVMMTLFLLLPFLFIPASFTLSSQTEGYSAHPVYGIEVDTFMLVERLTATIDGHNIPVYEVDSHVYSLEPTMNGRMEVTVTLINRQTMTKYIDVTNVDNQSPVIISNHMKDDVLYLHFSDAGSGINYKEIQAVNLSGEQIAPVLVDPATGCVAFDRPEETLNLFVPDYADNNLHIILSVE
ncbi:MAG: hypothetical protein HFI31_16600 [Lachnospiraceae bacterium]|nr:hypothetical protein [Lachnospiraceae bacterium]